MSNQLSFEISSQKLDQHIAGKWLINSTKAGKRPREYHNYVYKFDIKESDGNMFNPVI